MNKSSLFAWRRSIRVRIIWWLLLSFIFAHILTNIIEDYIPYFNSGTTAANLLAFWMFIICFLLFFFLLTRSLVRYLRRIADGLMSIAGGSLGHRVPDGRRDELGDVSRNINYMAEQLELTMTKEREMERSKMELITNVSHDLRTPLTSLIGYLNLLKQEESGLTGELKRYVDSAYYKSEHLRSLIEELFEYTRLTGGGVRLSLETIDLHKLIEQVITEIEPLAEEQELIIRRLQPYRALPADIDPDLFVRVIDNLLMNALKFASKPGEIKIGIWNRDGGIEIKVINEGKPLLHVDGEQLFDRFYKGDSSRGEGAGGKPGGAGLGLSIARNIVELHGGKLFLQYEDGVYSFTIQIPQRSAESHNSANESS
ncbi:sensor histidine kinase [Paenibacillus gorillae]|uniref:sensor histidine kinase n=1 Tax=Paenibacillus gorillae TaxID=1243662 RepID=UPI0005A99A2D|nr:HAMP domain-containing sensor histidine kinase [Paenibacillus gorillae]